MAKGESADAAPIKARMGEFLGFLKARPVALLGGEPY